MEGLNVANIDYACLGNHEFDLGFSGLDSILKTAACTTVINSNVDGELQSLPKFKTFLVGDRLAVIGGFLTDDLSIYPPSTKPAARPVAQACEECWNAAKASLSGQIPDLFLPMTHQLTPEDRKTGVALAKHPELSERTPIMLAGHDHEVFIEESGKTVIVKVGADAMNIGICDIWWTSRGDIKSSVQLLPASEFPADAKAVAFVKVQEEFLRSMMDVPIAKLPQTHRPLTTKQVRFEESVVASFLLSYVKRGQHKDGVDIAMIQGGAVRANADYESGADFTMGDLFQEFAFECHQAVIDVPGKIIAESVFNTRSAPKPAANFLHLDKDCIVTENHVLTHINGSPLDNDRLYRVSIYQFLLTGLNVIQPLLSYVQENVKVPDEEACRPVKNIVIECCMKDAWRQLIGHEEWDGMHVPRSGEHTSRGYRPSPEELEKMIHQAILEIDTDGDGCISAEDLEKFVEDKQHIHCHGLIVQLMKTLDKDGDGLISVIIVLP